MKIATKPRATFAALAIAAAAGPAATPEAQAQIPLAYALASVFERGHSGVFWAVFISETSVGLFTLWLFKRGGWKTMQV